MHQRNILNHLLITFLASILLFLPTTSYGAEKELLVVNGQVQEKYIRLFFYCKQPVKFDPVLKGNTLQVRFDRSFTPKLSAVLKTLKKHILKVSTAEAGHVVSFTFTEGNYQLRKFVSDHFVGVDLVKVESAPKVEEVKKTPEVKAPPKKIVKKKAPKKAKVKQANKKPKAEPKKKIKKTVQKEAPKAVKKDPVKMENVLTFPWHRKVGATVFVRESWLWVVFDRYRSFKLEPFLKEGSEFISDPQQIQNRFNTVLRFKLKQDKPIRVAKKGHNWYVEFVDKAMPPSPVKVNFAPRARKRKGIILDIKEKVSPLKILDPEIGDELILLPVNEAGKGMPISHRLVDYNLLATAQGVVVQSFADNIVAKQDKRGIELIGPMQVEYNDIIRVRRELDPEIIKALQPEDVTEKWHFSLSKTLFPVKKWRIAGKEHFFEIRRELRDQVMLAPLSQKNIFRLELARFYFAHEMYPEVFGVIKRIEKADSDFAERADVLTLAAATYFLQDRSNKAAFYFTKINDLETLTAKEKDEISFWHQANRIKRGMEQVDLPFTKYKNDFIKEYSKELQDQFALLAIENLLARHYIADAPVPNRVTLQKAGKILKQFGDSPAKIIHNDVLFYKGLLAVYKKDRKDAKEMWQSLTSVVHDRFNRARSEFSLVELQYSQDEITGLEAVERLNNIRNVWRGDIFERDLLERVGDLFIKNEQYMDGLKAWRELITYYPASKKAILITKEMSKVFAALFNEGKAEKLSNFQALSIYYEFRELTPIGQAGDLMVRNLADRLVNADLLDQAENLLSFQIKYRLTGKLKDETSTKLARIHLINHKPEEALELLDKGHSQVIHASLAEQRKYIRAEALIALGKTKKAIDLLRFDDRPGARRLQADVYWAQKEWVNVINTIGPFFQKRHLIAEPFSLEEQLQILRLAVAHAHLEQYDILSKLGDRFSAFLEPESKGAVLFSFLTSSKGPIDYRKLEETLQISELQTFIDSYTDLNTAVDQ